jgi:hypothetical protein
MGKWSVAASEKTRERKMLMQCEYAPQNSERASKQRGAMQKREQAEMAWLLRAWHIFPRALDGRLTTLCLYGSGRSPYGVRQQTLDGLLAAFLWLERGGAAVVAEIGQEVYRRLYTARKWRRPADGDFAQEDVTGGRVRRRAGGDCKPAGVR